MKNENLNFDLNLLPVISLLAVCISFLLLTAVWVQVGTLDVRQAMGESSDYDKSSPKLIVQVTAKDSAVLTIENKKTGFNKVKFNIGADGMDEFEGALAQIAQRHPEVKAAMVNPAMDSEYQSVVRVLESLKKNNIKEIGVSPIL